MMKKNVCLVHTPVRPLAYYHDMQVYQPLSLRPRIG